MSSDGDERPVPLILDGRFFKIIKYTTGDNVVASCLTCNIERKGSLSGTGNFTTHLKTHENAYSEYDQLKKSDGSASRKRISEFNKQTKTKVSKDTSGSRSGQQPTLTSFGVRKEPGGTALDHAVLKLVTNKSLSLSLVDSAEFKDVLIAAQRLSTVPRPMSRRTMCRMLEVENTEMVNSIKLLLKGVDNLCLTMDIWTCRGMSRAFFGVTVHWLSENMTRISKALACRRFEGSHTSERILEKFWEIIQLFEIQVSKVAKVVTDNGSNFTKAFKETHRENPLDEDIDDEEISFENVAERLDTLDTAEAEIPPHQKCAAHTLSLICVTDMKKFKSKYQTKAFAKCHGLWNKTSRSTRSSEACFEVCHRHLVKPTPTRWNSLFDSVECLLQLKDMLRPIFESVSVEPLTEPEVLFLEEYSKCVKPIAKALDRLQGDGVYYGELIPTLIQVKKELSSLKAQEVSLQHCKNLPDILLQGLQNRFGDFLNLEVKHMDAILAAVSHPFFKLRWVESEKRENIRQMFIRESLTYAAAKDNQAPPVTDHEITEEYFQFEELGNSETNILEQQQAAVKAECHTYFQCQERDLESLSKFPTVKSMFKKFNTALPSSAPVERLFSFAGLILTPNRQLMKDELFETLVLAKANKY